MEQLIFKALTSIMAEVEPIGKNKRNQQQGFSYRGIDDMYNELQPMFAKHKVFVASEVLEIQREERQTKSGGNLTYTILKVKFSFYTEDGSHVSSITVGEAMDSGDKGANKAMSVALKYCLMQLLLIPTEELKRDDPDGISHSVDSKANRITIKEAKGRAEEIKDAIKGLLDCKTIADLKSLKSQVPAYVVSNESFIDAAMQRYNEFKAVELQN